MKWTGLLVFCTLLFFAATFSRCGGSSGSIDTVATPIAAAVNGTGIDNEYFRDKVQLKTEVLYRANEYRRVWLGRRKPERKFKALVEELEESHRYGFEPEDYNPKGLQAAVEKLYDNRDRTDADISNLDIRISATFFLFTTHLLEGRVRFPGARKFQWERGMPLENDIALLLEMESASDLRKEIDKLHPQSEQYAKLQEALHTYRELAPADTFPPLPADMHVGPGESHDRIPLVRRKLALVEAKEGDEKGSTLYDDDLVSAVKEFQLRHGLKGDGVIGGETVRWLNVPLKKKEALVSLNLERLRWHPQPQGEGDEIVINVPEYMLYVYRNNREQMKMRVVLGAEYTPTPVFHDTLKYIVFSPTWIVPRSIFEGEFYPRLQEDPEHFKTGRYTFFENGKEIDPTKVDWEDKKFDISKYSMIENPSDINALGNVKFIMPNHFSIYLHDTPADQLFSREERALSHGCIRLERPAELAAYLLSDQKDWDQSRIEEVMMGGEPVKADLVKPYPVYIVYRTTWVDEEGMTHFRDDVYGHDQRHLAYLD